MLYHFELNSEAYIFNLRYFLANLNFCKFLFSRSLLPHSTVTVLQNVGHYPHWEDEKRFLEGYFEFLDKIGVKES